MAERPDVGRRRIVAVGLKTYLSYDQTRTWLDAAAATRRRVGTEVDVVVCPVAPALPLAVQAGAVQVGAEASFLVGAQDVSDKPPGAFTGELPATLLAEIGVRYVEIGHAERRFLFSESAEVIRAKTEISVATGLLPLLCVGEGRLGDTTPISGPAAVGQAGGQLTEVLDLLPPALPFVVAYEPVWAIGAEQPAPVDHVREVATGLRALLEPFPQARLIYGGTAGPGLFDTIGDAVDGLFLGRRAHDPAAFAAVLAELVRAG